MVNYAYALVEDDLMTFANITTEHDQKLYLIEALELKFGVSDYHAKEAVEDMYPLIYPLIHKVYPAIPEVGNKQTKRVEGWNDFLDIYMGFKDGAV